MKKIILYDPEISLECIERILKERMEKGESFVAIYHKREQILFYLEDVDWDIDILICHLEKECDKEMEFLDLCRKKIRHLKVLLLTKRESDCLLRKCLPDRLLSLPVSKEIFLQALDTLENLAEREYRHCLTLSVKGRLYRIPYNELAFIESEGHYITLKMWDAQIKVYGKLDDIEKQLPVYFKRCHKSYLVNLHYIRQLEMYRIKIYRSEEWIPVSQKYYKNMKNYIERLEKVYKMTASKKANDSLKEK